MSGASLPSWARKGVKVVCVDADVGSVPTGKRAYRYDPDWCLEAGSTYVIRRAFIDEPTSEPCVWLEEITRAIDAAGYEAPFHVSRFRPLVSTKTEEEDVAEFRKLLTQPIPEAV